jgi:pimeloyl-ACP methyl ester carboxylesterase
MGLGMQLVAWPQEFVQALLDAGYRVIRPDNRDVGLSQHMHHLGRANLIWAGLRLRLGLTVRPLYSLSDMAQDMLGLMDALGVDRAHVLGVSMGGMIGQRMALLAPQRVLSLCSVMSSSGAPGLPRARLPVLRALLRRPDGASSEALVAHYLRLFRIIGSPDFPMAEDWLRERIRLAAARGFDPAGTARQMLAIIADSARADELPGIVAPTLVFHGEKDVLLPFACGEDTARRIPGARLVGMPGMGHDLPPLVIQRLLAVLLPHLGAV